MYFCRSRGQKRLHPLFASLETALSANGRAKGSRQPLKETEHTHALTGPWLFYSMLIGEYLHSRYSNTKSSKVLCGYNIPPWLWSAYEKIGIFGFGAIANVLFTDIAKYTIGRLRPHFMAICMPNINCSLIENQHRYIEDYSCASNTSSRTLKEVRLSFPSGHSSFSAYTMIYLALYLQLRITWKGSKLVKHFLQSLCLLMAWFTALSRVSDYKHHWSDVLAGTALGTIVALVVANCVADLFKERRHSLTEEKHRAADYETGGGTQDELTALRTGTISYSGIGRNAENNFYE